MPTQIIKIGPGETAILPAGAQILSVTEFDGGIASSDCDLPTSQGTDKHYFYIEDSMEDGTNQLFMLQLVIGDYVGDFGDGFKPQTVTLKTHEPFIKIVKAMPPVLELRIAHSLSEVDQKLAITVPKGTPTPYFKLNLENNSPDWYVRLYPLETTDPKYSDTASDLADPSNIV